MSQTGMIKFKIWQYYDKHWRVRTVDQNKESVTKLIESYKGAKTKYMNDHYLEPKNHDDIIIRIYISKNPLEIYVS